MSITVPGYQPATDEDMEINYNVVTGSYFDATGIGIVEGRSFGDADTAESEPVAIVNETMARRYWIRRGRRTEDLNRRRLAAPPDRGSSARREVPRVA